MPNMRFGEFLRKATSGGPRYKNVVSEGTSPLAHNYGYTVRSYKDFVRFDIAELRTNFLNFDTF